MIAKDTEYWDKDGNKMYQPPKNLKFKHNKKGWNMTERQKHLMFVLQNEHFAEWVNTHRKVWDECSDKQEMWCICGRLATGLHENICGKFRDLVNRETVKKLEYLVKDA